MSNFSSNIKVKDIMVVAAHAAWLWTTQKFGNDIAWGGLRALSEVSPEVNNLVVEVREIRDVLLEKQEYGEEVRQEDFEVLRELCARAGWVPPHHDIDLEGLPK